MRNPSWSPPVEPLYTARGMALGRGDRLDCGAAPPATGAAPRIDSSWLPFVATASAKGHACVASTPAPFLVPEFTALHDDPDGVPAALAAVRRLGAWRLVWWSDSPNLRPIGCTNPAVRPALQFSADGRVMLTNGRLGAHLWEATTGREIRHFPARQAACAALSPLGDRVFIGGLNPFDSGTGAPIACPLAWVGDAPFVLSPDGQWLCTHGELWNIPRRRRVAVASHPSPTAAPAFSDDGAYCVLAGRATMQVVTTDTGDIQQLGTSHGNMLALRFRPGTRILRAVTDLASMIECDLDTADPPAVILRGKCHVESAALSNDASLAMFSHRGRLARVWNLDDDSIVSEFTCPERAPLALGFSPDRRWCFTGFLRVWETASGADVTPSNGWRMFATRVHFTANGRHLVVSDGERVRSISAETRLEAELGDDVELAAKSATLSPDPSLPWPAEGERVEDWAASPDGQHVAIVNERGLALLFTRD